MAKRPATHRGAAQKPRTTPNNTPTARNFSDLPHYSPLHRGARRHRLILLLILALVAAVIAELSVGAVAVPLSAVGGAMRDALFGNAGAPRPDPAADIVLQLRLPRLLLALGAGSALAVAGAAMQALFRNPLAEPGLAGVSAGCALAAAAVFALAPKGALGAAPPVWLLPVAAFTGGSLSAALLLTLARRRGQTDTTALLLGGIAINALAGAGIGWISLRLSSDALHSYLAWAYGDLGRASPRDLQLALPLLALAGATLAYRPRILDALLLGDAEAAYLGVAVEAHKRRLLAGAVLAAAATAAAAGPIAFVGLVAPHIARRLVGVAHRRLLPVAALTGALLLLLADLAARTLALPSELPVGLMTALFGAPFFLFLLFAHRRSSEEP